MHSEARCLQCRWNQMNKGDSWGGGEGRRASPPSMSPCSFLALAWGLGQALAWPSLCFCRTVHVSWCRLGHPILSKSKKMWEAWNESSCHLLVGPRWRSLQNFLCGSHSYLVKKGRAVTLDLRLTLKVARGSWSPLGRLVPATLSQLTPHLQYFPPGCKGMNGFSHVGITCYGLKTL